MSKSTNKEHVRALYRMANESWRGSPEFAALTAAIVSLSTPEPESDEAWLLDPRTVEAKAQWDAVARALGADVDDPDAVLAAAKAWRAVFIAERAARYREGGKAIEQARIHAETDAACIGTLAAQQPAPVAPVRVELLCQVYADAYHHGHHATVEGGYIDVLPVDRDTFWREQVEENYTEALAKQPPAEAQPVAKGNWVRGLKPDGTPLPPPSAPVGVEGFDAWFDEYTKNNYTDEMLAEAAWKAALAQQPATCVGCEGSPAPENNPCAVCGQQPAYDGGFTAGDMMVARQEGRREAQRRAAMCGPAATLADRVDRVAALLYGHGPMAESAAANLRNALASYDVAIAGQQGDRND